MEGQENDLRSYTVGGVRTLVRQVAHASRISRELLGQMTIIAFAVGIVFAGLSEAADRQDSTWTALFMFLFIGLLYLYAWTTWHWYISLDEPGR